MLQIDPIPAFEDNYIWALHAKGACALVDPGDAAPAVAWLTARQLSLTAILITHHHPDHVGGVEALRARYGDIPVYGPAAERIPGRTHALNDGDHIVVEGIGAQFAIWHVPGHTAGHIAYISQGDHADIAFVGDTLFAAGCGRLFEGTPAQMHHSLSRLAALPDATRVYCTHEYTLSNLRFALAVEPHNDALVARSFDAQAARARGEPTVPFTIATERATNPFLRADSREVKASAENFAAHALDGDVATFAALREWKNQFR